MYLNTVPIPVPPQLQKSQFFKKQISVPFMFSVTTWVLPINQSSKRLMKQNCIPQYVCRRSDD